MTEEQYDAILSAFFVARRTTRDAQRDGLTPAERKAAYDEDDAAVDSFRTALGVARRDITAMS